MNFQLLNKQRKLILIAAVAGAISVFLPWVKASVGMFGVEASESVNGFHGSGVVVFLAFAAAAVISLLGDQTKPLDQTMWLVSLAAGALALIFVVVNLINSKGGPETMVAEVSYGIGIWIALAASLGTVAAAWLFKNPSDTLQGGFDNIKKGITVPPSAVQGNANAQPKQNSSGNNRMAELEKLIQMKNDGKITEEEYQQLKSKLL
jgi:hypothetical protein